MARSGGTVSKRVGNKYIQVERRRTKAKDRGTSQKLGVREECGGITAEGPLSGCY